ncbi:hypothetical protein B7P43_G17534 [Cryptotermes secundus]|uniref:Tc1-like transposase DDE domain-containing protein n=1 Tax=Cryptotermes secundus TaxID=105785 RepID=A0A2J7RKG4_9NEOP|nr:hypothetical protein B7P43_G17534 [Cryptotermes secundus]
MKWPPRSPQLTPCDFFLWGYVKEGGRKETIQKNKTGKGNTHNCRIWGKKNPRVSLEHVRDSPKVNVFCALSKESVYSPFFFMETTITGIVYLDMLQELLIPQLDEDDQEGRIHFQQDGAPPH